MSAGGDKMVADIGLRLLSMFSFAAYVTLVQTGIHKLHYAFRDDV